MPEPETVAEGEQGVETATAQSQSEVDKPETTTPSEGQSPSDFKTVADLLDIPEELQNQIAPKDISDETKTDTPEPETEEEIPEVDGKKKKEEQKPEEESDEDDAEGEEDEGKEEEKPEQRIDKRQKRINRLTRQRSELEKQVDERDSTIEELQGKLSRFEKNGQAPVATVPKVGKWMPTKEMADQYSDLSQKKDAAEATLKWCDKYRNGVTITENGQERFVDPDEIIDQRRKAEMILMDVQPDIKVMEHSAYRDFRQAKSDFDKVAVNLWPDIAKKDSPLYQEANSILNEFPTIAASPAAYYYVGLAIEGRKAVEARLAASKNGNGNSSPQKRRDIDPKVFTTPRVPIAPHTADPPTRESVPSSQKKLKEANDSLMADPDGSAESLAKVFQARAEVGSRPNSRSPVTR
jgi:hypothetical protein